METVRVAPCSRSLLVEDRNVRAREFNMVAGDPCVLPGRSCAIFGFGGINIVVSPHNSAQAEKSDLPCRCRSTTMRNLFARWSKQ